MGVDKWNNGTWKGPYVPMAGLTKLDVVFGAVDKIQQLLPRWEDLPEDFKTGYGSPWCKLPSDWFFRGVDLSPLNSKKGIDKVAAIDHLSALLHSFFPAHEHKTAAVAYLASLWFEEPTWKVPPRPVVLGRDGK